MNRKRFDGSETPDWFFSEASETDETPEVTLMNFNWEIELEVCKITDDTLSDVEYQLSTATEVSEDNVPEEAMQEEHVQVTPAAYIADKLLSDEGA